MRGAIIGDIIGSTYEFSQNIRNGLVNDIKSASKVIQKQLSGYIFVQPWVFEFLLKAKIKSRRDSKDGYTIYTRLQENKKVVNPSIKIDKDSLDALKLLLKNYSQTIVTHTGKIIFYEEVPKLEINGFSLPLKWDERFAIARYMFATEDGEDVPWMFSEVLEGIGEKYYVKNKDQYDWLYERIRQFNIAIGKKIGYEDFFVIAGNGITLNEPYLFLLEKTHRIAQDPPQ
ncbi:hypothetical protein GX888_01950 [Candidatus Dojkabacteria bacterium]|uniref:Uncharacterized protein n=1 Tax=Candidatus Dojkabacteria bacterium TaxID=2099670 RepID=A0A847VDQ2_9BACT|nr:hypothetical protein [Candidatus Dojkabacteria bacterium]